MSDTRLRELERLYHEGDRSILPMLNRARMRIGLEMIRHEIVHYLKTDYHHRLNRQGKIDPRVSTYHVYAPCGNAQLFPRAKGEELPYTTLKEEVTCKGCLRSINGKRFSERPPALHMSMTLTSGLVRTVCGGRFGASTEDHNKVGCEGCLQALTGRPRNSKKLKLNARGRRRLRRQQMFPFKHGFPPVAT